MYGFPGHKMKVIGVTGTKGKTSTANFIWSVLQAGGHKTGIISTANVRIGNESVLNKYHMTMPGRFVIQRLMRKMLKVGCTHCVIETTSEGLNQYRHIGVSYDIGVFTNLTPEHLPSHGGSFDAYREAKGRMFRKLDMIIANGDDPHAEYFLNFPARKKVVFHKTDFDASKFHLGMLGDFNRWNALPAIIIGRELGIADSAIAKGLADLKVIPGRMELIEEGQPYTVIVDYAHEKISMTYVLETARQLRKPGAKIIVLLGAEGGGRDKSKRPIMGELSAKLADFVVVSNVDPYEDDPTPIAEDIAVVAEKNGKIRGKDLFVIEDRRAGIRKALELAKPNDIVLITGKGSEQSIIIGGHSSPWDDRTVVREELCNIHT